MASGDDLTDKGGAKLAARRVDAQTARDMMAQLPGWVLSEDARAIRRRWEFKGFAKAVEMANLAAWHGNKQSHHPDIAFGWGYCELAYTTHDAGGLTEADFACAARFEQLLL